LICEADKKEALELICEACNSADRKRKAADLLGLPMRTVQRWEQHGFSDRRKGSRAVPANKISKAEREQIIAVLKAPEFGDSNPNQIVPKLADQGIYLGSESTMYRILQDLKMNKHRQSSQPLIRKRPEPYVAHWTKPGVDVGHNLFTVESKGRFLLPLYGDGCIQLQSGGLPGL